MSGDKRGRELVFRPNPVVEQTVLAAELADLEIAKRLTTTLPGDAFLAPEHQRIHNAIKEAVRRGLGRDPATIAKLSGDEVELSYVAELASTHPTAPDEATLKFHVDALLWDRQRYVALTGPVASLLESIEKNESPDRVKSLARSIATSFDGWSDRQYLHDSDALIRDQIADVRARAAGRAVYPFGIPGLDLFDGDDGAPSERRRVIPGAAPGLVTVITGVPGSGKSTLTARIALGLARQRRKILFGAWEMRPGTTLELLACLSLDWSRTDLTEGRLTEEQIATLEDRMRALSKWVRFLANPFRRRAGKRRSNDENLDVIQGYIADSACDVFIADLWKRCLVQTKPDDEEDSLFRQQAMIEEMGIHGILVQQQRLKDIELRPDKRPTREGIKGSGAWTEIADNIFGVHRPHLWKPVPDTVLEIDILKQRYGEWPLAIEFDWDPRRGKITGGKSVEYDQPAARGEAGANVISQFLDTGRKGHGRR